MICPECRSEYRDGFYRCSDCDVALVWEAPRPAEPRYIEPRGHAPRGPAPGTGDLDLVLLLETSDPSIAAQVQAALEETEIPFLGGEDTMRRLIYSQATELHPVQLWVTREDEAEARAVLDGIGGPLIGKDESEDFEEEP